MCLMWKEKEKKQRVIMLDSGPGPDHAELIRTSDVALTAGKVIRRF